MSPRRFICPATEARCEIGGCLIGVRCMINVQERQRQSAERWLAKQERARWLEAHPELTTLKDLMDDD